LKHGESPRQARRHAAAPFIGGRRHVSLWILKGSIPTMCETVAGFQKAGQTFANGEIEFPSENLML
jgi:hypothetical protein